MTSAQTALEFAEILDTHGSCAWCGIDTENKLQVEKPRYGKAVNGVRVMKRRAVEPWCCQTCERRLTLQQEQAEQSGPVIR